MSGSTIRAAGLDRPQEEKRDEPPPLYTESGILKGHMPVSHHVTSRERGWS